MDEKRFRKLNDEITALGSSLVGDYEEFDKQSAAIYQRYGTTEAKYDKQLKKSLRELRRWRDSGFQDKPESNRYLKVIIFAVVFIGLVAMAIIFLNQQ